MSGGNRSFGVKIMAAENNCECSFAFTGIFPNDFRTFLTSDNSYEFLKASRVPPN